jgi:rfaE bifunctional protein nucleotidyltransferase chain/domain
MPKTLQQLALLREAVRPVLVGTINGAFDLFHAGHVAQFTECRQHCGFLIVLVNSDASVKRYKGPHRPICTEQERAAIVEAMRAVDAVGIFDEDDPSAALARIRPDVHFLGLSYADHASKDYSARPVPERPVIEASGGRILYIGQGLTGRTSSIIDRIRASLGQSE